ncbi:hypothetical protein FACS1894104_5860 [Actinomycetota bacterium]|nr:hypothetical protein FACS1894104_5860 [Actinomycetota bacterium]
MSGEIPSTACVSVLAARPAVPAAGLLNSLTKKHPTQGVLIIEDEGQIKVDVHVQVLYGFQLQEIANQIRSAVADALLSQACIEISTVDITIDGIVFAG